MAYALGPPSNRLVLMNSTCPTTHPVRVPLILIETVWDTRPFNDMWPTDGTQPFVLSQGDPWIFSPISFSIQTNCTASTGYGQHADYVFGWEGDALQRAMDKCTDTRGRPSDCTELSQLTDEEINQCTQNEVVPEKTHGCECNSIGFVLKNLDEIELTRFLKISLIFPDATQYKLVRRKQRQLQTAMLFLPPAVFPQRRPLPPRRGNAYPKACGHENLGTC